MIERSFSNCLSGVRILHGMIKMQSSANRASHYPGCRHAPAFSHASLLRKSLVFLLTALQLIQPFYNPAWAGEAVVKLVPGTAGVTIDQAPNGVPLVNIAAPNAAGVSHNRYEHFNVGPNGLLLNNSAGPVNTQLGGYIAGNTNLSTDSARLILNEVTGTRPSLLNGYLEVAGPQAEVVVANPNGITCRGCGFINTPQATLSTGTPFFGGDGALAGFTVANGFLRIEGTGLNASNLERLALYGRVLRINAALYAQKLDVVAGANHIDVGAGAATGAITPQGTAAALSSYGLDSSALGGMYANTIRLVGTEAGVGMRLAGPVAALTGDLEITNNGNVRLARVSAPTDLLVNANGYLWLMDNVSVGGIANLHATQELALTHQGQLTSGAATGLFAGSLRAAAGSAIGVYGDLTINADQQQYEGSVGTAGWLTINGDVIENSGHLAAAQGLTLSADGLLNAGEISVRDGALLLDVASYLDNSGVLQGTTALTITAADVSPLRVSNAGGQLLSNGEIVMDLAGGTFVNGAFADGDLAGVSGLVKTIASLRIESVGAFENSAGNVLVGDGFILNGGSLGNDGGTLNVARGDLDIALAGVFDNSNGVLIYGGDTLVLSAEALYNNAGQIDLAPGNASLMLDGLFDNSAGLLRQGGTGDGGLTLAAGALNNSGGALASAGTLAVQLSPMPLSGNDGLDGALNNSDGLLQGNTALLINAAALNNAAGQLRSNDAIEIDLSGGVIANNAPVNGDLNSNNGLIATAGSITLAHVSALQNNGGTVNAGNALGIFADSLQNNAGQIEVALGELRIDLAGDFDNSNGFLAYGGDTLILNAGALNNSGGQLVGAGAVVVQLGNDGLSGAALNNSAGLLQGSNALTISAAGLNNAGGQLLSNGPMAVDLRGGDVSNGAGLIQTLGGLSFDRVGAFDNTQGTVLAGNGFTLHADSATNNAGTIEVAAGAVNITLADDFDNSDGFFIHGASDPFSLSADALRNGFGVLMSAGDVSLQQNADVFYAALDNEVGFLQGNSSIYIAGHGVNNAGGQLLSNGSIAMDLLGSDLNNGSALVGFLSDGTADIRSGLIKTIGGIRLVDVGIFDNSVGYLGIGNEFSLDAGMLKNSGGRIEIADGETNVLLSGDFDNSAGVFLRSGSGELHINADTVHNGGGFIGMQEGAANIALGGSFDNMSGTFLHEGSGTVTLNADALDNRYGVFIARDIFSLQQNSDFYGNAIENSWGSLQGSRGIFVVGAGLNNSDGSIYSGSTFDVNLLGSTLNNRAGVIDVVGTAVFNYTDIFDNHAGLFQAGNGFFMKGGMFNNDAGKTNVINGRVYIDLSGEFSNEGGLFVHDENTFGPRFARFERFYLRAGSLDNRGGRIDVAARHSDVIVAGSFDNTDGDFVHLGEDFDFDAETLNNFQGSLASSGAVTLSLSGADTLNNREGLLQGNISLDLNLGNGSLDNSNNGRIQTFGNVTINAAFGVNNSAFGVTDVSGGIFSSGTINLNLGSGALDNSSGGRIQAFDAISIDSGSLNNAGGNIQGGAIDAAGNVLQYGSIDLNFGNGTLDNNGGLIQSTGSMAISNVSVLNNSMGTLLAGGPLSVAADTLLTAGGRLESFDDLSVHVRALGYDATSKLIAADILHLWLPDIRWLPMAILSAGGELHLQSDDDIVVDGWNLVVPGSLRLTAAHDVVLGTTTVGGVGNVVISGDTLSVAHDALLLAGNHLLIDVAGNLVNNGAIEAVGDIYVANSASLINGSDAYEASILSHWGNITLFADTAIYNNGSIIQATNGSVQLGSADRPVPLIENVRVGLNVGTVASTALVWSTGTEGNDYQFPDDAWWLEHCYHQHGYCGDSYQIDTAVATENARREQENIQRLAAGLAPLTLIDYKAFDPDDYEGVTAYLDAELPELAWNYQAIYRADHENRRFILRTDTYGTDTVLAPGRAGQIVSGPADDIVIYSGSLLNRDSVISAGASLFVQGQSVNEETQLYQTLVWDWWARGYSCNSSGYCLWFDMVPENHPATEERPTQLIGAVPSVLESRASGHQLTVTGTGAGGTVFDAGDAAVLLDAPVPTGVALDPTTTSGLTLPGFTVSGVAGMDVVLPGAVSSSAPTEPGAASMVISASATSPEATLSTLNLPANGLFRLNTNPAHPYLIETNPLLTSYDAFLGSAYLIERLDWAPGITQQRLGDGYYELMLIRELLLASIGSPFIDPAITDEREQFEYMMANGVAAYEALHLTPGIALSAAQIDALQADIIWLEEKVVAGQTVLVPVVYLAQGSTQLLATGVITGGVFISGESFTNTGSVLSQGSMQINVTGDLQNLGGNIQSVDDMMLKAGGDLVNISGTISGNNLWMQAGGDIINSTWSAPSSVGADNTGTGSVGVWSSDSWTTQVGAIATVTASGNLVQIAGNDIIVDGASLSGDTVWLSAGQNVLINTVEVSQGYNYADVSRQQSAENVYQLRSEISAIADLLIEAGNDITATAAQLSANGDIALYAGNDISLWDAVESAVSYAHSESAGSSGTSYVTTASASKTVVGTSLAAGNGITIDAGNNITLQASELVAGGDVGLTAGNTIDWQSAIETSYTLDDRKRAGDFGREVSSRDEVSDQTVVGTTISAGGSITATSQNDQTFEAVHLQAGGDITLASVNGQLVFKAVLEADSESHERADGDWGWQSMQGSGSTDTTVRQSELIAAGNVALQAAQGITIEIREVNEESVGQVIDAMVAENPDLAWLKDAQRNGNVRWEQVQETHEAWQYDEQMLGEGASIAIAIVVTALTAGAGAGVAGTVGLTTTTAATATAAVSLTTAGTIVAAAAGAVIAGAATQVTLGTINNGGNLGEAISDLDTQESVEGLLVAGVTAGLVAGFVDPVFDNYEGVSTDTRLGITHGFELNNLNDIGGFTLHAGMQAVVQAGVQSAVLGGSFDDYLDDALNAQGANVLSALAFYQVGSLGNALALDQLGQGDADGTLFWLEGGAGRVALHTLAGGLVAEATGGEFATGAAAAGLQQLLSPALDDLTGVNEPGGDNTAWRAAGAQLSGLVGAALVDGDLNQGVTIALAADTYNRQLHPDEVQWIKENAEAFAQQLSETEGRTVTVEEATKRLAQQAAKDVDLLWRAQLADGDDALAKQFLAGADGTFTNELNNQQQLFTVEGNQLLRPELFLAGTYANRDFYADNISSGVTRSVMDGLAVEIGQMGEAFAAAIAADPGAFAQSVGEGLWTSAKDFAADPLGTIADGVSRAGQTIGEGNAAAWDDDLSAQLNALYGQDVSGAQQTLAIFNTTMAGFTAVGVGKLGGALADKIGDAAAQSAATAADDVAAKAASDGATTVSGYSPDIPDITLDLSDAGLGEIGLRDLVGNVPDVPNGATDVRLVTSDAANVNHLGVPYAQPAFTPDQPVVEYSTGQPETYVRVYNDSPNPNDPWGAAFSNQQGSFMMLEQDIIDPATGSYLTPQQIQDKFALPHLPTKITDATVPLDFRLQTGEAAANVWGAGGATQFKAVDKYDDPSNLILFSNPRPLP